MLNKFTINTTAKPTMAFVITPIIDIFKQDLPKVILGGLLNPRLPAELNFSTNAVFIESPPLNKSSKIRKDSIKQFADELNEYCEVYGITTVFSDSTDIISILTKKAVTDFETCLPLAGVGSFSTLRVCGMPNLTITKSGEAFNNLLENIKISLKGETREEASVTLKTNIKVTTATEAKTYLKEWFGAPELTCDIETTGLNKMLDSLLTISFSPSPEESLCIAIHPKFTGSEEESARVKKMLKGFFSNYKGTILGHNFMLFDAFFVIKEIMMDGDTSDFKERNKWINNINIVDTLHIAYLLDNSTVRPELGLKKLAKKVYGDYDKDIDQSKLSFYSFDEVATYNNLDTSANFYVWNVLKQRMTEDDRVEIFEVYRKLAKVLLKLTMTGFAFNMTEVEQLEDKLVKAMQDDYDTLLAIPEVQQTIKLLNEQECAKYNASHVKQKAVSDFNVEFNLGSTAHKSKLLFEVLKLDPPKVSDRTGAPSTDKEALEELKITTQDENALKILNIMREFSVAAIVKNTFLKAFMNLGINFKGDPRLFTSLAMHGTVSGRLSSSNPNLQNLPSNSRHGKAVKNCFIAPEGFVFGASDYSALEDILIANESGCQAKLDVFLKGVDAHSLNALSYFPKEIAKRGLEFDKNDVASVNSFKKYCDDLRSKGKNATFAMAYGGGVAMVQKLIKASESEAKDVYNGYHELYSEIDEYAAANVETAKICGYAESVYFKHRLKTPNIGSGAQILASKESRTMNNFMIQSGSVLLLARLIELQDKIEEMGYDEDIQLCNTIYDCVYVYIRKDPAIIKWYNDTLIEIMTADYRENQVVKLGMALDIGNDWAHLTTLANNAPIEEIEAVLKEL